MMEIVPFDPSVHLGQVLELFLGSLRNTRGREWFEWKHVRNPFGPSIGYVAVENDEVIGVRLFMRWKFQSDQGEFTAIRPVDTVTKPEARGRGIFTKLTKAALAQGVGEYDLIFNTPNNNSLPGYLKMGWSVLPQKFQHFYTFRAARGKVAASGVEITNTFPADFQSHSEAAEPACKTLKTSAFMKWRYEGERYRFARADDNLIVFELLQKHNVQVFVLKDYVGDLLAFRDLLNAAASHCETSVILATNNAHFSFSRPALSWPAGKSVVALRGDRQFFNMKWNFSLGDLEGTL